VGLDVAVGFIAEIKANDPESSGDFQEYFVHVNGVLKEAGLPEHVEPTECESWGAQMFGYSGLHYLRRLAAHLDAGLPLPRPGDENSSNDRVLAAYFDDVMGKSPGFVARLVKRVPRFTRGFDHLIVHSDAEGFYLPQDFPQVLFSDDSKLPGGMLGSVPRLLAELERVAAVLGIPESLHSQSEELWEAADTQGEGDALWQRYGIESFSCVVLHEACRRSIATGSAVVFC
jgi:hypothetical protein